jgi:hydroxymethylpyrimidine pyrophosphatase-like HAD family hydrolase
MPSVVFADIDGTLIETCRNGESREHLSVGAYNSDGDVIAVREARHEVLHDLLSAAKVVVPVTGRSVGALERVAIRFGSYAVVHHGAMVLLPSRAPDLEFLASVRPDLDAVDEILCEAFAEAMSYIARTACPLRVYRQVVSERTIEVCVKSADVHARALPVEADEIQGFWGERTGVRLHRNGNNLALLPSMVTKERAVDWVADRLEEELGACVHFGVGDSTTDLGFMRRCDYYISPRDSQIDRVAFEGVR